LTKSRERKYRKFLPPELFLSPIVNPIVNNTRMALLISIVGNVLQIQINIFAWALG